MTTVDVATISIMVALSLGLFAGMITILGQMRTMTAEMGRFQSELRAEMSALREEVREELRRFGERLTRHEQSGH